MLGCEKASNGEAENEKNNGWMGERSDGNIQRQSLAVLHNSYDTRKAARDSFHAHVPFVSHTHTHIAHGHPFQDTHSSYSP